MKRKITFQTQEGLPITKAERHERTTILRAVRLALAQGHSTLQSLDTETQKVRDLTHFLENRLSKN